LIEPGQTEIREFQFTPVVNQDIRSFDIAMDDPFVVKVGQPGQHLMAE
jgi:hypothetical protein